MAREGVNANQVFATGFPNGVSFDNFISGQSLPEKPKPVLSLGQPRV